MARMRNRCYSLMFVAKLDEAEVALRGSFDSLGASARVKNEISKFILEALPGQWTKSR